MKLIIDIPEDYYEIIKHDVDNHLTDYRPFEIIANGTPLDDVIAEIKEEISRKANSGQWSDATVYGFTKAVAIIDKHIGKESEDTE